MKYAVLSGVLSAIIGFWIGTQMTSSEGNEAQEDSKTGDKRNRQVSSAGSGGYQSSDGSKGDDAITDLVEEKHAAIKQAIETEDPAEAIRLIRESIELEYHFGTRIASVCRTLSLMNEDNAAIMKAAFDQSWEAGFDYDWERQLFISRYSGIVGRQAVEEYPKGKFRRRAIGGWARTKTDEAIDWVNQLPEGQEKNLSINAVMWNVSKDDPEYGLKVFKTFSPNEQLRQIGELMQLTRRQGGAPACADLAEKLRTSELEEDRNLARGAYHTTLNAYREGPLEKMDQWLSQLPKEALGLLNPQHLPEKHLKRLAE